MSRVTTTSVLDRPTYAPFFTRVSLLPLSIFILSIGIVWRIVDIFVLGLGSTVLNILPSKLFPLLILFGIFWVYRRNEIGTVLGLSRKNIRKHLALGAIIGVSLYFVSVILPRIIYALMTKTTSDLTIYVVYTNYIWYEFLFLFINAIMEETLFRGILYHGFLTRTSSNRSIFYSAVIFGFWHICWPFANGLTGTELLSNIVVSVVFSGILGLFFAIYYVYFSSATTLSGTIVAHTLINFLNESFKVGTTFEMQGPDTPLSPFMMLLTAVFFLSSVGMFAVFLYNSRIEYVSSKFSQLRHSLAGNGQ